MKGKKHTPEQITAELREADGELNGKPPIAQVCQTLSISQTDLQSLAGAVRRDEGRRYQEAQGI